MTGTVVNLADVKARKMQQLYAEIEALDPDEAARLAAEHSAELTANQVPLVRLWSCPLCWTKVKSSRKPAGWLVVEPFTRVAACNLCRSHFR